MMDSETEAGDPDSAPAVINQGWQRRLLYTMLGCLMLTGAVLLIIKLPELTSPPHLRYPPSVQATIDAQTAAFRVQMSGRPRPVSEETLDKLAKVYGLEDCQAGGKYGALCHDGTYERTALLREDRLNEVCSRSGGVKEWIVCR
jgi:hypothetical protein